MTSNDDFCFTYVGVLEVLEKGNLPDGGAGRAFLVLQPDLLQGHQVVRQPGLALVHRGVRALQYQRDELTQWPQRKVCKK